jgi:hypothetical protein
MNIIKTRAKNATGVLPLWKQLELLGPYMALKGAYVSNSTRQGHRTHNKDASECYFLISDYLKKYEKECRCWFISPAWLLVLSPSSNAEGKQAILRKPFNSAFVDLGSRLFNNANNKLRGALQTYTMLPSQHT